MIQHQLRPRAHLCLALPSAAPFPAAWGSCGRHGAGGEGSTRLVSKLLSASFSRGGLALLGQRGHTEIPSSWGSP